MTASASVCPDNRTIGLKRARLAFAVLGTAQVTLIATITVLTVAAPAVRRDLALTGRDLALVTAAYGLSFGGLLLPGGRLADAFGHRRLFAAGMCVFGTASAGAGLAPGFGALLAARFGEGAGAALAAPAAMSLAGEVFTDPRRRTRAIALWGVLSGTGATAGNVVSGIVVTWSSWRWLFLPAVAVAALAVAAARILPPDRARTDVRFDWPGTALVIAGLTTLVHGLRGPAWAVAAALVPLVLLVLVERRSPAPLVPPALVRDRILPLLATALTAAAMATSFFLLALVLQESRGMSPLATSALFVLPAPVLAGTGVAAGRLVPRLGARRVLAAGTAISAAGLCLLSLLARPEPGLLVFPLGAGLTFAAASVAATSRVPADRAGAVGGLLNTAMEIGPPLGLTGLVALASAYSPDAAAGDAFALRVAAAPFLVIALAALVRRGDTNDQGETR